jgi:RNA polymerase sigma-70 factor, ECF subfamily
LAKAIDPDAVLLRAVGAGDRRAAETLVRRHLSSVYALARRTLSDAAEAEDVAQEAFIRAWKIAGRWREGEAKFETWLHRVTVNLCLDRLRKRRRETLDPDAGLDAPDGASDASEAMVARERATAVERAIAQLPDRQRTAIVLCCFQERTNIEAAAMLQISVDALESLLARGRRALKAALALQHGDLTAE